MSRDPAGAVFAALAVPANVANVSGRHSVFLTFTSGQPADFVNVNWIQFRR